MTTDKTLVPGLDSLAGWRHALAHELAGLAGFLEGHELLPGPAREAVEALRQRMLADKLVVAVVAEFSRGKSELVNAIFFADTGRRVLPATPGRTTMCPVELAWDANAPPRLELLPIETRRTGQPLAEWRASPAAWKRVALDPADPAGLAAALSEVTATHRVAPAVARELGLWPEDAAAHTAVHTAVHAAVHAADRPPLDAHGEVEIPAWRHAAINYPHPLLASGLVVLDTPGLNAVGTEPELTLNLLPGAHAVLFLLGADQGVTQSDLTVWKNHLGETATSRFVVLNKIDTLDDPLLSPAQIAQAVESQCGQSARLLQMPRGRVFPVSARQALNGRLNGDAALLEASRLPALEAALAEELLPRRRQVLADAVRAGVDGVRLQAQARLRDQRRQYAEELLELRGLRGKNSGRVRLLIERVQADAADFERSATRLAALRTLQARLLQTARETLAGERVRLAVKTLQSALEAAWLPRTARGAFQAMGDALRQALGAAERGVAEADAMLQGTFRQLNAEFGFALALQPAPQSSLQEARAELAAIERGYVRYFDLGETVRMATPAFRERFLRMLASKLRIVFETASRDIELWHQAASLQMESQLRDRRRAFRKRRDSLERIQEAAGNLEQRVAELEAQAAAVEERTKDLALRCENLAALAERGPAPTGSRQIDSSGHIDLPLDAALG